LTLNVHIDWPVNGAPRQATVCLLGEGNAVFAADKGDVAVPKERDRIAKSLSRQGKAKLKEVRSALEAACCQALTQRLAQQQDAGEADDEKARLSQADKLVALAASLELFHTPGGCDSEGYATFAVGGHKETWPVGSRGLRRYLGKLFFDNFGKVPGSQALQDAQNVIAGKAVHEGPECPVAVRLAEHGGALWLDLADEGWRVVRVGPEGWQVVTDCPVKFVRRRGMLPLPEPARGGSLAALRPLVNLKRDEQWVLAVAWLVAALRHGRPFPVLAVNGEQGSAKSTLCRMLRALIDPNAAPLRRPPRDDRDLMIAAGNGWVVGYDNLSGLSEWLADALCSLSTGGGLGTRELYSDDQEKLFDAMRPILLNGIEDVATRPDLMDRAVTLTLEAIPDRERQDEETLWPRFEAARPRILGALLDAVSAALRNLPRTRLASKPRMADFARWVAAAEPALPWAPGTFLRAYEENRQRGNALALEASLLTPLLSAFMTDNRPPWAGTLKDLYQQLDSRADEKTRKAREWPQSPRDLSGKLRRLAPSLRRAGIQITFGEHTRTGTPVTLEWGCKTPSPSSPPSPALPRKDLGVTVGRDGMGQTSPQPSQPNPLRGKACDGGDGGDGVLQACSNPDDFAWAWAGEVDRPWGDDEGPELPSSP
jgi:hypothetical protein